jgi:hypothetical protein
LWCGLQRENLIPTSGRRKLHTLAVDYKTKKEEIKLRLGPINQNAIKMFVEYLAFLFVIAFHMFKGEPQKCKVIKKSTFCRVKAAMQVIRNVNALNWLVELAVI